MNDTRTLGIRYRHLPSVTTDVLIIASDASYADIPETRHSSLGFVIKLFEGLIDWKSVRSMTVSTSSTETELLGMAMVAKETMALKRLFDEIALDLGGDTWTIHGDNLQTIRLIVADGARIVTKLRHVDIQNMWLRQEHQKGSFKVAYLATKDMPADGLTKSLPRHKFEHFRALLNLQDARALLDKEQRAIALQFPS